ncbi:MAG TPA: hypothetical protein DDZ53_08565 [Firmicutes bacterium]|nr:hypothetical protein [Bacillota bacterium]
MSRRKWPKLALCLLLSCLCLSACWDQRPIEETGLISGIGIDKYPANPNLLNFTIAIPLFLEDKREAIKYDTLAADNLGQAEILWEHRNRGRFGSGKVGVVLFGEEVAQQGLSGFLDYLQLPQADDNAFVAVTKGRSDEVLRAKVPETERTPLHLQSLLRTAYREGHTVKSTVADLAMRVAVPGFDPILPLLQLQGENRVSLVGAALFQDANMVGVLSQEEMQLFLTLFGKAAVVSLVPIVGITEQLAKPAVEVELHSPKVRIKPKLVDGELQVGIELKAAYVLRNYSSKVNVSEKEPAEAITRDIESYLQLEFLQLLAKLQDLRVDPLGIGKRFRVSNYQQFDPVSFREQWAQATIDLKVELQFVRIGALHTTLGR